MADVDEYGIKKPEEKVKVNDNIRHPNTEKLKQYYRKEDEYNPEISAYRTPSGHYVGHDNTPGKERMWYKHASGTGFEMLMDGSMHHQTIGNQYQYNKGGVFHTVEGNMDMKVGGHQRHSVTGGSHEEVRGNKSSFVAGGMAVMTGGMYNHQSVGGMSFTSEKTLTLGGAGKGNDAPATRITLGADGTVYITAAQHLAISAGGDIGINAGGKISFGSGDSLSATVGSNFQVSVSGKTNIGGKEIHLAASKVYGSKGTLYSPNMASASASDPSPESANGGNEGAAGGTKTTADTTPGGSSTVAI